MNATKSFMARGARIRGLHVARSQFGNRGPALWLGTRQIAHTHRRETVEIRLTRRIMRDLRAELLADARVDLRRPGSDWIVLQMRFGDDVERGLELLRHAMRANRPNIAR